MTTTTTAAQHIYTVCNADGDVLYSYPDRESAYERCRWHIGEFVAYIPKQFKLQSLTG